MKLTANQKDKLKAFLKSMIEKELDEISSTNGSGAGMGYMSKNAFTPNTKQTQKRVEDQGYEVVDKDANIKTNNSKPSLPIVKKNIPVMEKNKKMWPPNKTKFKK